MDNQFVKKKENKSIYSDLLDSERDYFYSKLLQNFNNLPETVLNFIKRGILCRIKLKFSYNGNNHFVCHLVNDF